ncbi:MAG: TlpA family protein disulfide reductase [Bacteroidales bacterium]|nr:TlpA family protein disulfide reductase [Bacteroidales bacterium]
MKKTTFLLLTLFLSLNLFCQNTSLPKVRLKSVDYQEYFNRDMIGKKFPLAGLTTLEHKKIDFHALHGHLVFINFWFKGCHACMNEMPGLEKLYEKYKGSDVLFVSVSFDKPEVVRAIQQKYGLSYQMVSVDVQTAARVVQHGYPTSFLIDSTGTVVYARSGSKADPGLATEELMEKFGLRIEALTGKKP